MQRDRTRLPFVIQQPNIELHRSVLEALGCPTAPFSPQTTRPFQLLMRYSLVLTIKSSSKQ